MLFGRAEIRRQALGFDSTVDGGCLELLHAPLEDGPDPVKILLSEAWILGHDIVQE
jgi:hypothetical protein